MDVVAVSISHHDWGRARRTGDPKEIARLRHHPDLSVRLGLLENPHVSTEMADAVALEELRVTPNEAALMRVYYEIARSRRVSEELLWIAVKSEVWEVWAILLHNPQTPKEVLERIAAFTSEDEEVQKEFTYLIKRAKERLEEIL